MAMASSVANQNVFRKRSNSNNLRIRQASQALKEKNIQTLWNELSLHCKQSVVIHIYIISNCQQKSGPYLSIVQFYISIGIITFILMFF